MPQVQIQYKTHRFKLREFFEKISKIKFLRKYRKIKV